MSMSTGSNKTIESQPGEAPREGESATEGAVQVRYVSRKRHAKRPEGVKFAEAAELLVPGPPKRNTGAQELRAPFRRTPIHVRNRPPRFPPGAWPIEMRADMTAAYLDFPSTRELCKAVARGEAPKPDSTRGAGAELEVIWSTRSIDEFVSRRRAS